MPIPPIAVAAHPLLDVGLVLLEVARLPGDRDANPVLAGLLDGTVTPHLVSDDEVRAQVRDLLRASGFKPTGRSKPSSEYLLRAREEGRLGTINLLVDLGNAVSLHSGLPISVVDLERTSGPLSIVVADPDAKYVFNASGQEIDVGRLICLCDSAGPCANAVKDAQRTKIGEGTHRALVVVWGTSGLPGRTGETCRWLMDLAARCGIGATPV